MMPTYSFGEESPLKFTISDKLAINYNEAVAEYLAAQRRFLQKYGRQWNPDKDPIALRWSKKNKWAWNEFARVLANSVENDGRYSPNEILDDFLVRNGGSALAVVNEKWLRAVGAAALVGALYGLLRGR